MLPLREALKNASEVLVFRIGGGAKATGTSSGLTVGAKYPGARGNDIAVVVKTLTTGGVQVDTTLAGQVVDSQVVATAEDLIENDLVTFTGSPEVTDGTITLSGGTDTAGTGADYADFFDAIQVYDFNTMAIPVEDSATKALAAGFARRVREEEGKKVQVVLGNYEGADFEARKSVV